MNSAVQRYAGGIFDDETCHGTYANHAIVKIGYNIPEGYWILQNSWGEGYGEQGNIRIKMGSDICQTETDRHFAGVASLWKDKKNRK